MRQILGRSSGVHPEDFLATIIMMGPHENIAEMEREVITLV